MRVSKHPIDKLFQYWLVFAIVMFVVLIAS